MPYFQSYVLPHPGENIKTNHFEFVEKRIKMDFEAEMKKLEGIAAKMDGGNLPLEESMKLYTEAVELTKKLKDYIEQAKRRVEALEGN